MYLPPITVRNSNFSRAWSISLNWYSLHSSFSFSNGEHVTLTKCNSFSISVCAFDSSEIKERGKSTWENLGKLNMAAKCWVEHPHMRPHWFWETLQLKEEWTAETPFWVILLSFLLIKYFVKIFLFPITIFFTLSCLLSREPSLPSSETDEINFIFLSSILLLKE